MGKLLLKYKIHHVLFWLCLFAGWYFLRYQDFSTRLMAVKITSIKVIDLAMMVYITNLLLIPKLLYRKHYFFFILAYVSMIFCSSVGKQYLLADMMQIQNFSIWNNFKVRLYDNIIPHYLLVSTGAAIKLLADYARTQRRLAEITKEKAESELKFLKSQINPHFIFNSLNSIYFLIDKSNRDARESLHKFSEMLRYQLYECGGEKIEIEKEIKYLEDYVDLQRLRKDDKYKVEFHCSHDVGGFAIEPLLLIPFVENSFKHISHFGNGKINQVSIDARKHNGEFVFTVANTVDYASKKNTDPVGGIGLRNVKRRLELLYPDKHHLEILEKEGWFRVDLRLRV